MTSAPRRDDRPGERQDPETFGIGRLFDQVHEAIIMADAAGQIILWNRAAESLFGWSAEEALRQNVDILVPPRLLQAHHDGMARYATTGHGAVIDNTTPLQIPALHKDGSERRVEMTLSPFHQGNDSYSLAIIRDVTERVRLEEILEAQRERTRLYDRLAQLALTLGSVRDDPRIHRAILAFVREEIPMSGMFISRYDASTGMRTCEFAYSEGEEMDCAPLPPLPLTNSPHSRAVATGEVVVSGDFDADMVDQPRVDIGLDLDPSLPQSALVVPMLVGSRVLGAIEVQASQRAAFHEDHVTIMRLAANLAALALENARHLRETESRAHDLDQKVQERTRELAVLNRELEAFNYAVAHDLRAPLRAVLFLAEATVEDYGSGLAPEVQERLDKMQASARRMGALIDDLLTLAKSNRADIRLAPVDLSSLARTILDDLQTREPEQRTQLRVPDGITTTADPGLTRIVLENLLRNAWKYSRGRPEIVIEVGERHEGQEQVFFVRDQGAGFDQRQAYRLFEPFQRLHSHHEYEGTGIGLATVARIVRRHGGRIWAEGAPDQGATFYFTLAPPSAAP